MAWKTPRIVEVPVGMKINMYACAAHKSAEATAPYFDGGGPPVATKLPIAGLASPTGWPPPSSQSLCMLHSRRQFLDRLFWTRGSDARTL